jgi:hypothetical protein
MVAVRKDHQPPEAALLFPLAMRAGPPNRPAMNDAEDAEPESIDFSEHIFPFRFFPKNFWSCLTPGRLLIFFAAADVGVSDS